jgi:hypothetical protein
MSSHLFLCLLLLFYGFDLHDLTPSGVHVGSLVLRCQWTRVVRSSQSTSSPPMPSCDVGQVDVVVSATGPHSW